MARVRILAILTLAAVVAAAGFTGAEAVINGSPGDNGSFVHRTDGNPNNVYRYGPSIIMNGDGTGDAWFCAPAYNGAWDQIAHKTTSDYGVTWSSDSIVLAPTAGSRDAYSNCDPGAIKFGGYYYIGYTSTEDSRGTDNQVYVARSTSPTGPFQKWNGSGWGGNPQPFILYNGPADTYGAGEPSFVAKDGTLYIYYTWIDRDANGASRTQTRVATASVSDPNWPGTITYQGVAMDKSRFPGSDSADVKYIDALNKFVAVTAARRFGPSAYLQFWESADGITFVPSNVNAGYSRPYLHNAGLSGDALGHIDLASPHNFVAYAFGPLWADWDTYRNPISFSSDARPAPPHITSTKIGDGWVSISFTPDSSVSNWELRYGTASGTYSNTIALHSTSTTVTGLTNGVRYYFSVVATNGSGSSDPSEETYATPEQFANVPIVSGSASSSLTSAPVSASFDGNGSTFYSSIGHTTSSATEFVVYDLGAITTVGRISITARPGGWGGPKYGPDFHVQVSADGSNWQTIDYTPGSPLDMPVAARYVRLLATSLKPDPYGNYYLQIAEVKVESLPIEAYSKSSLAGWEPFHVIDADSVGTTGVFSSNAYADAAHTEWLALKLGATRQVTGIVLTPRSGGLGFPVKFSIQTSMDGTASSWSVVPGQAYASYPNPGSSAVTLRFANAQTARYVRVVASQLGSDGVGNYLLQLAQVQPLYNKSYSATSSSVTPGLPASNALDGNRQTFFSSTWHTTASANESITVDLGSAQDVSKLRLIPRDGYAFPSALRIESSVDGTTWSQVPGQIYEKFPDPAQAATVNNVDAYPEFDFRSNIWARYIKIIATELRQDNYGTYYFQLAEIEVNP